MFVTEFLVTHFAELLDVTFTAQMEEELDQIGDGERPWLESLREYYAVLEKILKAGDEAEDVKRTGIPIDEKCPKCGKDLVIKSGRFGRFKACSGYPECTYKESLVKKETKPLDEKCPQCGAPLVIKFGRSAPSSPVPTTRSASTSRRTRWIPGSPAPRAAAGPSSAEDAPGEVLLRLQPLPEMQVRDLGRAGGQALPGVRPEVRPEEEPHQGRSLPLLSRTKNARTRRSSRGKSSGRQDKEGPSAPPADEKSD